MDAARHSAPRSPHPTNKIAAALWHPDFPAQAVIKTNQWPNIIIEHFGKEEKIGNSSGTIHAETNVIVNAKFPTQNTSICITDPFCPNCAKNIAEAGIKNIYIDEAGFDGDFFKRRGGEFETMSMKICQNAGINVFAILEKSQKIRPILEIAADYVAPLDSPITIEKLEKPSEAAFQDAIANASSIHQQRKVALAFVKDVEGQYFCLTARAHAVEGFSMQNPDEALTLLTPIGKYSFIQEPVNRMLMTISRYAYSLEKNYFYCSQVPTSREQVNLVGANINRICIGNLQKCRDRFGFEAMQALSKKKIIDFT